MTSNVSVPAIDILVFMQRNCGVRFATGLDCFSSQNTPNHATSRRCLDNGICTISHPNQLYREIEAANIMRDCDGIDCLIRRIALLMAAAIQHDTTRHITTPASQHELTTYSQLV